MSVIDFGILSLGSMSILFSFLSMLLDLMDLNIDLELDHLKISLEFYPNQMNLYCYHIIIFLQRKNLIHVLKSTVSTSLGLLIAL